MPEKKLITRERLMELTRKARGEQGQKDIAEEFDVSQAAISQAENDADSSLDDLRKKIVREYLEIEVEGPTLCFEVQGELDD